MTKLTFGKGNAKLDKAIITFSLPAGYTCPGEDEHNGEFRFWGDYDSFHIEQHSVLQP